MPLFARIRRVLTDLKVDVAITETQLLRHYGLRDLGRPVRSTVATIFPSASLDTYQHCKIFALSRKVIDMSHGELLHLISTAEMRHALGVPSDLWISSAHRQGSGMVPDALWATPDGNIAIGFDTGTYRYTLIKAKIKAFEKHASIVWGTPSSARAVRIKKLFPHVRVLCVAHLEHLPPILFFILELGLMLKTRISNRNPHFPSFRANPFTLPHIRSELEHPIRKPSRHYPGPTQNGTLVDRASMGPLLSYGFRLNQ